MQFLWNYYPEHNTEIDDLIGGFGVDLSSPLSRNEGITSAYVTRRKMREELAGRVAAKYGLAVREEWIAILETATTEDGLNSVNTGYGVTQYLENTVTAAVIAIEDTLRRKEGNQGIEPTTDFIVRKNREGRGEHELNIC